MGSDGWDFVWNLTGRKSADAVRGFKNETDQKTFRTKNNASFLHLFTNKHMELQTLTALFMLGENRARAKRAR